MNYISLIEELKKRGSVPGLDAIEGLLEELGHPEDNLKIVHIAGTNGKGLHLCLSFFYINSSGL